MLLIDTSSTSFQVYPKLSQTYYVLLECLAQDHMNFLSTLEPNVFLYVLSSISEGLSAIGKYLWLKKLFELQVSFIIILQVSCIIIFLSVCQIDIRNRGLW